MASNYTHQPSVRGSLELASSIPSDNLMQQTSDGGRQAADAGREATASSCQANPLHSCFRSYAVTTNSNYKKFNDVKLIRDRHIKFNPRVRKQLELLCEDRVSRHKLEEIHCSLPSSIKSTFIMTFSPDGRRVASTHGDHRIYICDLNTGKLLDTLEGHPKTPLCLAWHSSNGEILASGCLAGEVRVWDLRSKACESWTSENHTIITSLDFHPKERVLVIATANDILFWDWSESEPFAKTTTMHDREKVKFVVFDSSGTKLITGISNLPKYTGCSGDSLQNRIIDGYLAQGGIDQLPTENMTQNSEIATSPVSGTINSNENFSGHDANSSLPSRRSNPSMINGNSNNININNDNNNTNEQDINYRNTLLLTRVAFLYRQLEALEDSLRHTSFAPFMNLRSVGDGGGLSSTERPDDASNSGTDDRNCRQNQIADNNNDSPTNQRAPLLAESNQIDAPPKQDRPSQDRPDSSDNPQSSAMPISNTFEPYLVTFDESLEQLQLPTLIMDGRIVDLATVIDQYPVDISRQLYHAMQFESISQVNQNFIRISKLMCSARLYRQIVHQIMSACSSNSPHQPNQILTAQSVSPRSPRNSSHIPVVLRNFPLSAADSGGLLRTNRAHDPVMGVEIRSTARNMPLTTICKIDLLAARTICILRSQNLVEQAIANARPLVSTPTSVATDDSASGSSRSQDPSEQQHHDDAGSSDSSPLQSILGQLHSTLTMINHAPLTTSNAYSHITTLRVLLEKLYKALSALLRSPVDGRRLGDLMHSIAFSLTGRRQSMPLGANLDEIRLDVIHTLCIADLTLHFVRQIQLLQMQRISLIARVEESRRPNVLPTQDSTSHASNSGSNPPDLRKDTAHPSTVTSDSSPIVPSTSNDKPNFSKRKSNTTNDDEKRRRLDGSADVVMGSEATLSSPVNESTNNIAHNVTPPIDLPDQTPAVDRMALWNSPQSQIEQSLQRFLMATTSSMNNSHILVRVYHRLHGMPPFAAHSGGILDPSIEPAAPQVESRRRALSQDNSVNSQEPIDASSGAAEVPPARARIRAPAAFHVNLLPPGSNHQAPTGLAFDAWQRQPHLHVYLTRGSGQHLWFNQWTIPLPMNNSNYRLQCWNFARGSVPNIKDSQSNVITHKCRIHNDSSVDLSSNGSLLACLVPRDDGPACFPSFDLKIFSLKAHDFGSCYYKLLQGPNALSVSLSPSGNFAVVGLATHKSTSYEQNDDDLAIGKVFKLSGGNSFQFIRDIKIKRDDPSSCLNAIKWMPRGIVYSVGPQHLQRYQTARMRNVVAS